MSSFPKKLSKNASLKLKSSKLIKSFTTKNAKISSGRFPVILFSPGFGMLPQTYENTITHLVSHGFIVVALNSAFINGSIYQHGKTIIPTIIPKNKQQKKLLFINSLSDFKFIYQSLHNPSIFPRLHHAFNLKNIGLLGHSLGAAAVAHLAENGHVKAVVTLDLAWDFLYPNACRTIHVPFLELFSTKIYYSRKNLWLPYLCKKNKITKTHKLIVISDKKYPDQLDYSVHMSFTDESTLQYQPIFYPMIQAENASDVKRRTGLGNGWKIAKQINDYLLVFFTNHLK